MHRKNSFWHNLGLIVSREFTTRVKKKSFILLTILMPFLFAAIVFVPFWLANFKGDEAQKTIAVADYTKKYVGLFKSNATYRFEPIANANDNTLYADTSRFEAVVDIQADPLQSPKAVTIYSPNEVKPALQSYVENLLNESVREQKLQATGIPQIKQIIENVQTDISVNTMKRTADGQSSSSDADVAIAAAFLLTFLIYLFVLSYGAMVMQSVMEEKTNRIVELMVSSVKPFELMMGKIIGIALMGLVQLAIWGVMFGAILTSVGLVFGLSVSDAQTTTMLSSSAMTVQAQLAQAAQSPAQEMFAALSNLPYAEMSICFVLYFVGGYLLYASFFAAVGASVNESQDTSQFMGPVVVIMMFSMYAAMGSIDNTNGPLAFWASLFPLTSPIVMMVRIPFSVPLWQEILSLALLFATSLFTVWFSGRIYRIGILMYGKKPTIKEMIKWIRYR